MNNHEFIASYGEEDRAKWSGNLYRDYGGNIFSYSDHYPLLFRIGRSGKWYRNIQGYSNSTSKHIGIAGQYADIDVEIPNSGRSGIPSYEQITGFLNDQINSLESQEKECIRKGTKKHQAILDDIYNAKGNLNMHLENKGAASQVANGKAEDPMAGIRSVGMVAAMGEIFHAGDQKAINDWKVRMLKAGLENKGLIMPDDWDQLSEEEKDRRLSGAIDNLIK